MRRRILVVLAASALALLLDCSARGEEREELSPGLLGSDGRLPGGPFDERRRERDTLVDRFLLGRDIEDRRVVEAVRRVPRHRFVPLSLAHRAYEDTALPIGYGQTISQPYVVAFMTQALELTGGDKVLEIGTGSGYQAAVLGELVEQVYSIEIVPELSDRTRERLATLGYGRVRLRTADGYYGWSEEAPFDRMIVTAAVDHVPLPLLRQLAPGGIMILPLGPPLGVQTLLRIRKDADGGLRRESLLTVRFVPMTGRALK